VPHSTSINNNNHLLSIIGCLPFTRSDIDNTTAQIRYIYRYYDEIHLFLLFFFLSYMDSLCNAFPMLLLFLVVLSLPPPLFFFFFFSVSICFCFHLFLGQCLFVIFASILILHPLHLWLNSYYTLDEEI